MVVLVEKEYRAMLNQQILEGRWQQIKGQIRSRWGQISGDELDQAHGDVEQLVGTIQRQTGLAREEIESYLEGLTSEGGSRMEQARHLGEQAAHRLREGTREASDMAMQRYEQAQQMIQQHPMQTLATCFGIGVLTGVLVGMTMRSR
jgi:uncharacterized protein YjbJ (UPF0337 family)